MLRVGHGFLYAGPRGKPPIFVPRGYTIIESDVVIVGQLTQVDCGVMLR